MRNLFEFAVGLNLRKLQVPVSYVGSVLYVLSAFEGQVRKVLKSFHLPQSLLEDASPAMALLIVNGHDAYFAIGEKGPGRTAFGPLKVGGDFPTTMKPRRRPQRLTSSQLNKVVTASKTYTEVHLLQIARKLHERLEE